MVRKAVGILALIAAASMPADARRSAAQSTDNPDLKTTLVRAADALGMLRGLQLEDSVVRLEYWATGTVNGRPQPYRLADFRASINYAVPGMGMDFACTGPGGQPGPRQIHVVSGNFAWNEETPGINATSTPTAVNARLVQLWITPQGVVKAATAAGAKTTVGTSAGATILTFPIPGVPNAIASATLNADYLIDRVDTRVGRIVTETTYSSYADWNAEDYKSDVLFLQKDGPI